jgi:hypothetical protein
VLLVGRADANSGGGSSLLAHQLDDLAGLREAAGPVFGVDQLAVDLHVEHAAAAGHEFGFDVEGFLELSRQTGGFRFVVSNRAVRDADVHRRASPWVRGIIG